MSKSLSEMLSQRPVDRAAVEAHKDRMIEEVRAYRLQELREAMSMTPSQLALRLGVGQNRTRPTRRNHVRPQRPLHTPRCAAA